MSQFSNFYETALTLFNAALGNFDLSSFSANSSYKFVGVALMVMYVLGTDILLINLIIARMTVSDMIINKAVDSLIIETYQSTYDQIDRNSYHIWAANKVRDLILD